MTTVDDLLRMIDVRVAALGDLRGSLTRCHELGIFEPSGALAAPAAAEAIAPLPAPALPPRRVARTGTRRVADAQNAKLDVEALQASIVAAITRAGRPLSVSDLMKPTGVSRPTLNRRLPEFAAAGALVRHGSTRNVAYGLPGTAAPAPAPADPEVARGKPGNPRHTLAELKARVMRVLEAETAPTAFGSLSVTLRMAKPNLRAALNALEADGAIVRRGVKRFQRIGTPRVMAAAAETIAVRPETVRAPRETKAPDAEPTPVARETAPVPRETADRRLVAEIMRVLKSGASYDPREIRRNVLTAFPTISVDDIVAACEAMAREGQVARHVVGQSSRRYQLRVRK
jgi:DNA-binding HxlR family transcriptional regulator